MIYDFKSENLMQDVVSSCLCPIIDDIEDEFYNLHRFDSLAIYAPSCIAREILCRLLKVEDIEEEEIGEDFWFHEESDEFLLWSADNTEVIVTIGYDGMIWVEYARLDDGHIKVSEATLSYVYDEFSQRDVLDIIDDENSVLVFGFEDEYEDCESYNEECCENCCGCEECCTECNVYGCKQEDDLEELCDDNNEDDIHDVSVKSEEQYFVNGKSVSKDEYEKFSKEFNEKMKEFIDFMNRRIFFHW